LAGAGEGDGDSGEDNVDALSITLEIEAVSGTFALMTSPTCAALVSTFSLASVTVSLTVSLISSTSGATVISRELSLFPFFTPFDLIFSETAVIASSLFPGERIGGAAAALAVCLANLFLADFERELVSSFFALCHQCAKIWKWMERWLTR
jgi:hypothetical protein